jgi:hypothetical protein
MRGLRAVGAVLCVLALADGCGIALTEELSGRPCKEGVCLPGYVCRDARCVPDDGRTTGGAGAFSTPDASAGAPAGGWGGEGAAGASSPDAARDALDGAMSDAAGEDASEPPEPTRVGHATCRDLTCDLSVHPCCVANVPGYPDLPSPAGFSCRADVTGCQWVLRCDGDHDCAEGEVCCAEQISGVTTTQCLADCTSPAAHVECTHPSDCEPGLVCCGRMVRNLILTPIRYDRVLCQASCSGVDDRIFCDPSAPECPDGWACGESALFPGMHTCQP